MMVLVVVSVSPRIPLFEGLICISLESSINSLTSTLSEFLWFSDSSLTNVPSEIGELFVGSSPFLDSVSYTHLTLPTIYSV